MACQACERPAQLVVSKHDCHTRCCSSACGQALYAGIRRRVDGNYRVSIASPLGAAIVAKHQPLAQHRSLTLPKHTLATLIGALQYIGPPIKRTAASADLAESSQAAAPNQNNWLLDRLPPELWTTILGSLDERRDLRSFAAASSEAAMLARTETVQVANVRRNLTLFQAILTYSISIMMPDADAPSRQRILRMAYPDVALMALTTLLALDLSTIEIIARKTRRFDARQYFAAIDTLREHANRCGPALFTRPLRLESGERIMLGAIRASLLIMNAMDIFVSPVANAYWKALNGYLGEFANTIQLETPDCIGVYAYIAHESLTNFDRLPRGQVAVELKFIDQYAHRGLNLRRPETAAAILAVTPDIWYPMDTVKTFRDYPAIALNAPPTGKFGLALGLHIPTIDDFSVCAKIVKLLRKRGQLEAMLLRPIDPADPNRDTLLFAARNVPIPDDHHDLDTIWPLKNMHEIVVPAASHFMRTHPNAPSPFLVRDAAGMTPLMVYMQRGYTFMMDLVYAHDTDFEWSHGYWGPFEPLPATLPTVAGLPAIILPLELHDFEVFELSIQGLNSTLVDNDIAFVIAVYIEHKMFEYTFQSDVVRNFRRAFRQLADQLPDTSARKARLQARLQRL